jgi:hypothetical protein
VPGRCSGAAQRKQITSVSPSGEVTVDDIPRLVWGQKGPTTCRVDLTAAGTRLSCWADLDGQSWCYFREASRWSIPKKPSVGTYEIGNNHSF